MSLGKPMDYLVCYDIRDPRRLQRVHRYLRAVGIPLHYSVFQVNTTPRGLLDLLGELAGLLDLTRDDLRAYPLPARPRGILLGRPPFLEGLLWTDTARDPEHGLFTLDPRPL